MTAADTADVDSPIKAPRKKAKRIVESDDEDMVEQPVKAEANGNT